MKVYKILHKPTGLFFKPGEHLTKQGKTYTAKPSLSYINTSAAMRYAGDGIMTKRPHIRMPDGVWITYTKEDFEIKVYIVINEDYLARLERFHQKASCPGGNDCYVCEYNLARESV